MCLKKGIFLQKDKDGTRGVSHCLTENDELFRCIVHIMI